MKLLILKEKYGDDYILCATDKEIGEALIATFEQRKADGHWYFDEDLDALDTPQKIIRFMWQRQDAEYESFDVETPRTI